MLFFGEVRFLKTHPFFYEGREPRQTKRVVRGVQICPKFGCLVRSNPILMYIYIYIYIQAGDNRTPGKEAFFGRFSTLVFGAAAPSWACFNGNPKENHSWQGGSKQFETACMLSLALESTKGYNGLRSGWCPRLSQTRGKPATEIGGCNGFCCSRTPKRHGRCPQKQVPVDCHAGYPQKPHPFCGWTKSFAPPFGNQ